jgi:hypothetical protein
MYNFPAIVRKAQRVFICHYQCDACPNEWEDELLAVSHSWCPCCDAKVEPYYTEEFEVERPEFDLGDDA